MFFFSAHECTVGISLPGGATGIGDHFLESFEGKGPNNYHQRDGFSRLKWRGSKKSDHLSKRTSSTMHHMVPLVQGKMIEPLVSNPEDNGQVT